VKEGKGVCQENGGRYSNAGMCLRELCTMNGKQEIDNEERYLNTRCYQQHIKRLMDVEW